jgi:hypothetical protein
VCVHHIKRQCLTQTDTWMVFFVTHMYVSHTLNTLQQIEMNNMKTDFIFKKYDGFLVMYG